MGYARQKLRDFSDLAIKQINDNFSAIWLKLSGNIDTLDLKDKSINGDKVQEGVIEARHVLSNTLKVSNMENGFGSLLDISANGTITSLSTDITANHLDISTIQQDADSIELKVATNINEIDNLDGRVSSAESSITLNADEIALKVTSGDVKNMLNINTSGVQITASNIDLNGITRVNKTLEVGGSGEIGTIFINDSNYGTSSIGTNGDNLELGCLFAISLSSTLVHLNSSEIDFNNATITNFDSSGIVAKFG